jgi:hypothetical protein
MRLSIVACDLAVCRLGAQEAVPRWAKVGLEFLSVTRTLDELSIVCDTKVVPAGVRSESGWTAIKVEGPLDFGIIGTLASLLTPLANAGVPVFAVSTFDTDYVLVRKSMVDRAKTVLEGAGHDFR